jgi:hypothetical protein
LGDTEEVIVALKVTRMIGKLFPPVIGLPQFVTLDHRAHRAIHDDNTFRQDLLQEFATGLEVTHTFEVRFLSQIPNRLQRGGGALWGLKAQF